MKRLIAYVTALLVGVALTSGVGLLSPASAHIANGGANCENVWVHPTKYEADHDNTWRLTMDDTIASGVFGASTFQTLVVPQDGAVHNWSWEVSGWDGKFHFSDSGTVGPCNNPPKPTVCHPVEGKGETGTGWNVISPAQASSHIDEELYPDGHYWKHETKDGRHDVYADEFGNCPPPPTPTCETAPSPELCPQPPAVVTHGSSTDEPDCKAGVITTHHWTITTEYVWDSEQKAWVLGDPVRTEDPDTTVPTTAEECPPPPPTCQTDPRLCPPPPPITCASNPSPQLCPQPPAIVTHGESTDTPDCKAGVVVTHHWTITTPYVWSTTQLAWVPGQPVRTEDPDTTVPVTEQQCPVPPKVKHAWVIVTSYCNAVRVEGRHNAVVTRTQLRPGVYRFHAVAKNGAVFRNGKTERTFVRSIKRGGYCHSGS